MSLPWCDVEVDAITALVADLDETLIRDKSMFSLLEALASRVKGFDGEGVRRRVLELAEAGRTREEVNREYYAALRGLREGDVVSAGRSWFAEHAGEAGFWIPFTVDLVTRAVDAGVPVVLVSGSCRACLDPVARHLGVQHVLCTELEVGEEGTIVTGRRLASAIGEAKRARVLEWAGDRGVDLAGAVALGDHESDVSFMELAGTSIAVNPSVGLTREAARRGWRSIESPGDAAA